jgi:hypothetical protein
VLLLVQSAFVLVESRAAVVGAVEADQGAEVAGGQGRRAELERPEGEIQVQREARRGNEEALERSARGSHDGLLSLGTAVMMVGQGMSRSRELALYETGGGRGWALKWISRSR